MALCGDLRDLQVVTLVITKLDNDMRILISLVKQCKPYTVGPIGLPVGLIALGGSSAV